jgi:LysR family hydrogen peroxide-inducible transcriptional activator
MISLAAFTLRDLEYVVSVARLRHFGRAAQACGVSQPALSEQVRKLEAVLGLPLFERGGKAVQVTPPGQAIVAQAERVLAEARGLIDLAQAGGAPLHGPLELGAIQTLGPYYLPRLLGQARAAFPDLALRLTEGRTDGLLASLRAGSLDAVLLALPVPSAGIVAERLFFEPFEVVCPRGHRLADLPRLEVADLSATDLILLEEGHCLRDQTLSLCGGAPSAARHAASVETLFHMIAAGEGFSLLPALSLQGRGALAPLVTRLPLPGLPAGRSIALAWRATDPRGPNFSDLGRLLRDHPPPEVLPEDQAAA